MKRLFRLFTPKTKQSDLSPATSMKTLSHIEALESVFEQSNKEPVLIYKHSAICPLSQWAYQEITKLEQEWPYPVYQVVVQEARPLSDTIAQRTGIRHESPQVIVLYQGQPIFHTSHGKIRADYLKKKLQQLTLKSS